MVISKNDPLGQASVNAIQKGDVAALRRLLEENPGLANARVVDSGDRCHPTVASRTLLHVATDWPGHCPNGAATVAVLVDAGADVNARFTGSHTETPLHWAASSDDVEVLDVLLDRGADIEAGSRLPQPVFSNRVQRSTGLASITLHPWMLRTGATPTNWRSGCALAAPSQPRSLAEGTFDLIASHDVWPIGS